MAQDSGDPPAPESVPIGVQSEAVPPLLNRHPDAEGVLDAIATTRTMRRYRPDPVPEEDLARLLFAASRAPSGSNRQEFRFLVLRDGPEALEAKSVLGEAARALWAGKRRGDGYDRGTGVAPGSPKARMAATMAHHVEHFEEIPVVILVTALRHRPPPEETIGASVYPACQNLLLAARALGYGAAMTSWHVAAQERLREVLGIPEDVFLAATITLGAPEGRQGAVRRAPLGSLVFDGRWDQRASWAVEPPGTRHTSWRV